eukprot:11561897-Alexandrium_andersonii.AAC.1
MPPAPIAAREITNVASMLLEPTHARAPNMPELVYVVAGRQHSKKKFYILKGTQAVYMVAYLPPTSARSRC